MSLSEPTKENQELLFLQKIEPQVKRINQEIKNILTEASLQSEEWSEDQLVRFTVWVTYVIWNPLDEETVIRLFESVMDGIKKFRAVMNGSTQ